MSMALMVAMAARNRGNEGGEMNYGRMETEMRRRRDDRGRFMEGDMRMDNDHSTHMGGYDRMEGNYSRMDNEPEMRRRRDSRGRYMEDEEGPRMAYDGNAAMRPWPDPHIPPYLDRPGMNDGEAGRMRDRNIVNIRDYQDKRQIGFGMNDERGREMRQYGRRYNPDRMSMYEAPERQKHQEGRAEHQEDGRLTREEAEEWVKGMKSEDGKTGGRWPYQEIKQYASNFGIHGEEEVVEFFAVMNALATDYGKVARKYGVDKVDFWADLAKAFIHDKDAVPDKVRVYYECIAKKDEE